MTVMTIKCDAWNMQKIVMAKAKLKDAWQNFAESIRYMILFDRLELLGVSRVWYHEEKRCLNKSVCAPNCLSLELLRMMTSVNHDDSVLTDLNCFLNAPDPDL